MISNLLRSILRPQPSAAAVALPGSEDRGAANSSAAMIRVAFAALLTAIFAHAQLTAATMWTLITGQGAYRDATSAWTGIMIYVIGTVVAFSTPRSVFAALQNDTIFRWLARIGVLLGFTIVYPTAFHYYYDMPSWLFSSAAILTLALGLLSLRWCQLLIPFSWLVTVAIGSFLNVPHYTWDITDLRHTLNVLAILNGVVIASAVPWCAYRTRTRFFQQNSVEATTRLQPDRMTLLVLTGFGCVIGYFYAGFGKVAICSTSIWMVDGVRWIWLERLDKFFQLFFHMGCTWLVPTFSPQDVYDLLGNTWVRCTACGIVLAGELAVILFLFSRRFCMAGLIACQLLHLGFAFMCGTYFTHWFLINILFLCVFSKPAFDQMVRQWTWFERLGITAAAITLCPLIFHTSVLAWSTDRSQLEIFTWHASPLPVGAVAENEAQIGEPQIDPNQLFPYEKSFQMSWRFARLIKDLEPARAERLAAKARDRSVLARMAHWYKLRMVGEWHEHLPRPVTREALEDDLQRLLARYHHRRASQSNWVFPAYYTHMAYNWRLMPKPSIQRREPICSYLLVRQELHPGHGCVYLAASPVSLCRIAVPLETSTARR